MWSLTLRGRQPDENQQHEVIPNAKETPISRIGSGYFQTLTV